MDNYDDYYEDGDSEWRWLCAMDKAENITSLCSPYNHKTILEIGAGEGSILKRLSELNFGEQLFALEVSSSGIQTIINKAIPQLIECNLFDGYTIPYQDNQFELAILSHVIEHVEYPRRLVYEASRVAGNVFVEVPLENTNRLQSDFVFDRVGHINFYSPKTIKLLLQTCNLTVMNQSIINPSKNIYFYMYGKKWKALAVYYLKELFLKYFPKYATNFFIYNSALICSNPG